jgi:hypothetical protein
MGASVKRQFTCLFPPVLASAACAVKVYAARHVNLVSKIRLEAPEKKNSMASKHKNGAEPGWSGFGKPTLMKIFFSWARE